MMTFVILFLLLILLLVSTAAQPVTFSVERNGTLYTLNAGLCESFSCGSDERRGSCLNEIYRGRAAHYCRCNLPFTGSFCDETIKLNAALPDSVYADCALPLHCPTVYGNGQCNEECNNAACLYDGYECVQDTVCPNEEYCRERFADGICDDECSREECEFDGGDCFGELDTLPGQLMLRLSITAQEFMRLSHLFLFQLSRFLRATVVLSQDTNGPLVWEWSEERGRGARVGRGENSTVGIEVSFSVDLTRCSSECLESIGRVVQFIDQAIASKSLPLSSALSSVISASSASASSPIPSEMRTEYLIVSMGTVLVLVAVLIGVIAQQRTSRKRTLTAPIWKPPVIGQEASPVYCLPEFGSAAKRQRQFVVRGRLLEAAAGGERLEVQPGDDVNMRDECGLTPLLLVIRSERREADAIETVRRLLNQGAKMGEVDEDGWGALHHALHKLRSPGFVRRLIEMGASTQVIDNKGRTVVHLATEYDDPYNLRVVLEAGAKKLIDLPDHSNRVPLSMAVTDCHLPTAACLLQYYAATENVGEEEATNLHPDLELKHPIHYAVQYNNIDHVRLLIRNQCRLDVLDSRERTPLHHAALTLNTEMARVLVEGGCPVDYMDEQGRTAEDIAIEYGHEELVSYLVSVRGQNERRRKTLRSKRYSSDGGYCSEESGMGTSLSSGSSRAETPVVVVKKKGPRAKKDTVAAPLTPSTPGLGLPTISPYPATNLEYHGVPEWGVHAQLPLFQKRPHTPATTLHRYPTVLTPSTHLLPSSSPPSLMTSHHYPHSSYPTPY